MPFKQTFLNGRLTEPSHGMELALLSSHNCLMPSSVIDHIMYDASSRTLRVMFLSGSAYAYSKVPLKVYQAMKDAPSKGKFLNKHIKGVYRFRKLD